MSINPENTQAFRDAYRAEEIGEHYSGVAHFLFTATASVVTIGVAISQLQQVQPLEWLTIPLTFVYANLAEYFGHRGPMHHPSPGLRQIYRRHTKQHHRFFTDQCMAFDSSRDFKAVLFPPSLIVFFLLGVLGTGNDTAGLAVLGECGPGFTWPSRWAISSTMSYCILPIIALMGPGFAGFQASTGCDNYTCIIMIRD